MPQNRDGEHPESGYSKSYGGPDKPWAKKWEKGEKRISKICFIGRKLDKKAINDAVMACIENTELRFKVGDLVDCKLEKDSDTYEQGTVTKLWDGPNAYRVKLDSGDDVWVYADDEEYITKAEKAQDEIELVENDKNI